MITPPPVNENVSGADKQFSFGWKRWIQNVYTTLVPVQNYGTYSISSPSTGFSLTVPDSTEILQLAPSGTLASGSVTFPAFPMDKQQLTIATTQTITSLVLVASAPIFNPITTLTAGQAVTYYYSQSAGAWYNRSAGGSGGGGSGTPAGSNGQIQFNNLGAFGASSAFEFSSASNTLTVPNVLISGVGTSSINGTSIGSTTPDAGSFTTLNGQVLGFVANASLTLSQRTFRQSTDTAVVASTTASVVVDDSNLTLAQRTFKQAVDQPLVVATTATVVVDDANLTLAQRTFKQTVDIPAAVSAIVIVDDVSLTLSQRTFKQAADPPLDQNFILAAQIFGG